MLWIVCGGTALACSLLAGHHVGPTHAVVFLALSAAFALVNEWKTSSPRQRWRPLVPIVGVVIIGALLSAVQWLPSADWARHVYRWIGEGEPVRWGEKIPYSVLESTLTLAPQDAVSLLIPHVPTSGMRSYEGAPVLFLALVGVLFTVRAEIRFLGALGLMYFFASWGRLSALHGWLNTFVPGVWFAREVCSYLVPFRLCLALLAGSDLDCLFASYSAPGSSVMRVFVRRAGWGTALLVSLSGILAIRANVVLPRLRGAAMLAIYLAVFGVLLFLLQSARIHPLRFRTAVIALVFVDLSSYISASIPSARAGGGTPHPRLLEGTPGGRIYPGPPPDRVLPRRRHRASAASQLRRRLAAGIYDGARRDGAGEVYGFPWNRLGPRLKRIRASQRALFPEP
jgi:hypothetical protein